MEPSTFRELRYDVADGVATVTLDRPDRRNTWSGPMAVEYRWALHHAHHDPDVRVVVLTGAGETFCAGADTGALQAIGERGGKYTKERTELPTYPDETPAALRHNHLAPLTVSVPVIAAINGACAGAGFVLAAYADQRWAAAEAKVATSFAALGLPAEYGIGWMLPRIVGTSRSLELLYDPAPRTAEDAMRLGFIDRVVPGVDLLDAVLEFARRLARHSAPESLASMKRAVLVDAWGDLDIAYRRSVTEMDRALEGSSFATGVAAMRARRRPDFLAPTDPHR